MTVGIISHANCLQHTMGREHPESPNRLITIQNALEKSSLREHLHFYEAIPATIDQLKRTHSPDYVDFIFNRSPKTGNYILDPDTVMSPHTLQAACLAAGSVRQGVDLVMENKEASVFCNVRPPGHHAEKDQAMGFCFFNNIAVGATYAIEKYKLQKIAIVDFDVHHGNGTEDIFSDDNRILLCSSFQYPFYPHNIELKQSGHILHLPLPAYSEGNELRKCIARDWIPALIQHKPELIFISAGFDGHKDDPLANLKLTTEDYYWITEDIVKVAKQACDGKIVSALEGGYSLAVLGLCVEAHIKALLEIE